MTTSQQAPLPWSHAKQERCEDAHRREAISDQEVYQETVEIGHDDEVSDTVLGYLVRDVHRSLSRALQARIANHGVSMGQWFFLRALWDQDGLTQRELSQRVGMMEPTTVTALNGMERRGLVERVRNIHDRRKVNIFLTPKGRALREVLMPCSLDVNHEATRGISSSELALAMNVLRRMMGNLTGSTSLETASSFQDNVPIDLE